jgi:shikimate kinase
MMACGKSTVGPRLARLLERGFLDSDREVERRAGRTITEIFHDDGEARFRELEAVVIGEVATGTSVVALGGGAIAQPGAAERLGATGTVIYLRAQPEALVARIRDPSSRPLLAGLSRAQCAQRIAQLLDEREPAYLTATIVVDTDRLPVYDVARDLADQLLGRAEQGKERT